MKTTILLLAAALALAGCATATFTSGRPFDVQQVGQIERGKTTSDQIISWLGVPFSKSIIGNNSEIWVYSYMSTRSHAQSYVVSTNVQTSGVNQRLQLSVKNGVVTEFTYTDSPIGGGGSVTPYR